MFFKDNYNFLSNFYILENPILGIGMTWFYSVENAYLAEKIIYCLNLPYEKRKEMVQQFKNFTSGQAKSAGKRLSQRPDFDRTLWQENSIQLMTTLVQYKFRINPDLMTRLKAIEGEIVEDNNWGDTFWGRCYGVGENHLGRILMKVRDEQ